MKTPDLPEEKPSAPNKRDYSPAVEAMADSIKQRIQAGEIVGARDFPESERALFWGAIKRVQDDMPRVRSIWSTVSEQFIDGLRTREKRFKLCPRQRGFLDAHLAGSILFLAACAMAFWWPL